MELNTSKSLLLIVGLVLIVGIYLLSNTNTSPGNESNILSETYESQLTEATPASVEPSERALKVTANGYVLMGTEAQNNFLEKYGDGNLEDAIRQFALLLDENPEKLAYLEALVKKISAKQTETIYIEQDNPSPVLGSNKNYDSYFNDVESQLREQQNTLDKIEREQKNRELWEMICPPGETYDSLVGAGCK